MVEESKNLEQIVTEAYLKYLTLDDQTASVLLSEDQWSLKEIMGHLVDSASNNHQRFVRLQEGILSGFPAYNPDWVKIQKYNQMSFKTILDLWKHYNQLLVHVIANINPSAKTNIWKAENNEFSLEFLVKDYLRHLQDHLKQFNERCKEISK